MTTATLRPKNRERNLLLLAGSLLLGSTISLGIYLKAQHDLNGLPGQHTMAFSRPQAGQPALVINSEADGRLVAKARELRDTWRGWAFAHKDVLNAMRQSNGDTAALERAWSALPSHSKEANFAAGQLKVEGPLYDGFTWNPHAKVPQMAFSDPQLETMRTRGKVQIEEERQHVFAREHNIVLSQSMNAGPTSIRLWVDGRLTRSTRLMQKIPGKPAFGGDYKHEEIEPAFDFVR